MRMATAIAAVVFALLFCVSAAADIPEVISYQGVLKDDAGVPVADGTYDITFRLYDVETGGTMLWQETQSLLVEDAIMNAHLGSVVNLTGLDFLVPYWLSIEIEAEGELVPRTMWTTVPYAAHASFADGITNEGGWKQSGDDVYRDIGNVGVGLEPVDARLDVFTGDGIAGDFDNGSTTLPTVRVHNAGGTAGAFYSCVDTYPVPTPYAAVYGRGACGARGGHFYSTSGEALYAHTSGTTTALLVEATGTGYAAQFLGDAGIQVQYQADVGSFRMFGGSSPGYVLTSDSDGVGTWQPAGGSDSDWILDGDNLLAGNSGLVGIGAATPVSKLEVETDDVSARAFTARHTGGAAQVADISRTSVPVGQNDILQITAPSGSPDNFQFIECERGSVPAFQVQGNGQVVSSSGASFADDVTIAEGRLIVSDVAGPVAEMTVADPTATEVLYVMATDESGTMDGAAVRGTYVQSTDYGIGGYFTGGWRGVYGEAMSVGGEYAHYGVYGTAGGSTGMNYGVYGSGSGAANIYAGYFYGDMHVNGTLSAVTKSFKIDHPLDPANKYLLHACVESDEMANMYAGNVTLDESGRARVQLPDWFEALNANFRYQLTAIGAPGPNLYVAEKISGNVFVIAGGDPGMEVSWMVTGVRNDPAAREHRLVVEVDKSAREIGKYMQPEAYGMPLSAGVDYESGRGPILSNTSVEIEPRPPFDPTDGE